MLGAKDIMIKSSKIEITICVSLGGAESYEYFFGNEIKRDTLDEHPALKNPFLFQ